ncbi:hypothetical protein B0H13DRAFT_1936010 [Mycena leptocephala]|nr:hypothetical protein B0H13DRAFT_1936010 [Mycena leptocephala]
MPISRLRNCSRIDGGNRPIAAALGSGAIACDPQTFLNRTTTLWAITSFLCAFVQNLICSNIVHLFKVVLIKTRTPPHIKHKQKAVSPIQFSSSHLRLSSLAQAKFARSLPHPLTGRTLPTCSKHNGRLLWCLLYLHSLCRSRLLGLPLRPLPNNVSVPQLPRQRRRRRRDDFDPMKFPAANSAFTADGERIHPYTSSLPMQVRASPHPHPQPGPPMDNADPFAPLPPPHIVSPPPPDYSASVGMGCSPTRSSRWGWGIDLSRCRVRVRRIVFIPLSLSWWLRR